MAFMFILHRIQIKSLQQGNSNPQLFSQMKLIRLICMKLIPISYTMIEIGFYVSYCTALFFARVFATTDSVTFIVTLLSIIGLVVTLLLHVVALGVVLFFTLLFRVPEPFGLVTTGIITFLLHIVALVFVILFGSFAFFTDVTMYTITSSSITFIFIVVQIDVCVSLLIPIVQTYKWEKRRRIRHSKEFSRLDFILSNEELKKLLFDFCCKEWSVENLEFLLFYRQHAESISVSDLKSIYEQFIKSGSPYELNISSETKRPFLEAFQNENVEKCCQLLGSIKSEVEKTMSDTLSRFIICKEYTKWEAIQQITQETQKALLLTEKSNQQV